MRRSALVRSEEFKECVALQAHHLDLESYDHYFAPGAYLQTHAEHMARWHGGDG